jgi:hypothetical protein
MRERRAAGREASLLFLIVTIVAIVAIVPIGGNLRGAEWA